MVSAQPDAGMAEERKDYEPYKYLGLAMLGCEPDAGEYSRGTKARLKAQKEQWCAEIDARGERCRLPFFAEMGVTELTDIQKLTKRRDKSLRGKPVTFASCGITMPGQPLPITPAFNAPHSARVLIRSSLPDGPDQPKPPPSGWVPSSARTWSSQRPSSSVPNSRRTHLAGGARLTTERPPPLSVLPPSSQSERARAMEKWGGTRSSASVVAGGKDKGQDKAEQSVGAAGDKQFVGEWWLDGILKEWNELQKLGGVRPKTVGLVKAMEMGEDKDRASRDSSGVKSEGQSASRPARASSRPATAQKATTESVGEGAVAFLQGGATDRARLASRGDDALKTARSTGSARGRPPTSGSGHEVTRQRPQTAFVMSSRHRRGGGEGGEGGASAAGRRKGIMSDRVGQLDATPRRTAGASGYSVRYTASVDGGQGFKPAARASASEGGGRKGDWSDMLVREIVMRTIESQQSARKGNSGGGGNNIKDSVGDDDALEGVPRLSARSAASSRVRPKTAGVLGRGASFLPQSERHVLRSVGAAHDRRSRE